MTQYLLDEDGGLLLLEAGVGSLIQERSAGDLSYSFGHRQYPAKRDPKDYIHIDNITRVKGH